MKYRSRTAQRGMFRTYRGTVMRQCRTCDRYWHLVGLLDDPHVRCAHCLTTVYGKSMVAAVRNWNRTMGI